MTAYEQIQLDNLRTALRDLAMGATMMLAPPLSSDTALTRYASEVRRVAEAALGREVRV